MRKSYVPLREFIYDRLYHPKLGYFCKKGTVNSYCRLSSRIIKSSNKFQEAHWI